VLENSATDLYAGPIIDAHHHVWDLSLQRHPWLRPGAKVAHRYGDYEAIKHDYLPTDFLADINGQQVVASVYVEAEWDPQDPLGETRWVEQTSKANGLPGAMAAQAWLDAPDAAQVLAAQAAHPLVRSIRHKPGGARSPAEVTGGVRSLLSDPRWQAGYALLAGHGLHFELQTPWWNLPEAAELADRHPETLMVINHAGVVLDHQAETLQGWRAAMAVAAKRPNMVVKVSGLCVEGAGWVPEVNREIVLDLVRLFGADRLMFGSNFPVDRMFIGYAALVDGYRQILARLEPAQQRAFFHDTAARIYAPHAALTSL
jgi:predicted TIM-barrel fold metal-dependent hydrolase